MDATDTPEAFFLLDTRRVLDKLSKRIPLNSPRRGKEEGEIPQPLSETTIPPSPVIVRVTDVAPDSREFATSLTAATGREEIFARAMDVF